MKRPIDYVREKLAALGLTLTPMNTSRCPFSLEGVHDAGTDRDVLWFLDGEMPHAKCQHTKCQPLWDAWMAKFYQEIRADKGNASKGQAHQHHTRSLPPEPEQKPSPSPEFNLGLAKHIAGLCPKDITEGMLSSVSPVPVTGHPATHGRLLIDSLYDEGEKIMVYTRFASQGQFLALARTDQTLRLGRHPGIAPVPSFRLPQSGREGVWFQLAPVTGEWQPNPMKRGANGELLPGRRHTACCTRFPYLLLESDVVSPALWLRILAMLHDPIVAIYTSGGKSYHALIRVDCRTAEEFNAIRERYIQRLTPIGADSQAMSAVRLSRLPGCLRQGTTKKGADGKPVYCPYPTPHLQKLIYLAPAAEKNSPIINLL